MKLLPVTPREWLSFGIRFGLLCTLLASAAVLMTGMPGSSYSGQFEELSDEEHVIRANIYRHVSVLAGSIGERNTARCTQLQAAAGYIKACFEAEGCTTEVQSFAAGDRTVCNVDAQLTSGDLQGESLIVGAHYDSALGSPGANDNATGVAGLLELARLLKGKGPGIKVRLVAFANEEPPYFQTKSMGSSRYALEASRREERIRGMVALETIGYYSDLPGSQQYPFGFGLFYPGRGDFIAELARP